MKLFGYELQCNALFGGDNASRQVFVEEELLLQNVSSSYAIGACVKRKKEGCGGMRPKFLGIY